MAADADGLREIASVVVGYFVAYYLVRDQANTPPPDPTMTVQAPWWTAAVAVLLALLLTGCNALTAAVDTIDRIEASHCATSTPLQRAQDRQALIDTLGEDRAAALFVTCPRDSAGYHPAMDGGAERSHPLLE